MASLRGLRRLVHDTVAATTRMVGDVEDRAAERVVEEVSRAAPLAPAARAVNDVRRLVSASAVGSILGINLLVDAVGTVAERVHDRVRDDDDDEAPPLVPMTADTSSAAWLEDACLGALNGLVGDHLHRMGNDLDLGLHLRLGDAYVAPEAVEAERVVVLVHGLCATEWCFCIPSKPPLEGGVHFGERLQADFGLQPVFLRYNSGRHIWENGRAVAELLDRLPAQEILLVGHSMGGLVLRSALHAGRAEGLGFVDRVSHLVCMGSPHQGSPLEKAAQLLTTTLERFAAPGAQIPARILKARSDGIRDLRHGFVVEADAQGAGADAIFDVPREDLPYEPHITYAFIATNVRTPDSALGYVVGDLLVRRGSARGPAGVDAARAEETFDIRVDEVDGVPHFVIQNHPEVYARLSRVLAGSRS